MKNTILNNCWSIQCIFLSKYILSYYFSIHLILLLSLGIIEIRFSIVYDDFCPIDDRITLYLLIFGIIHIIYSFNGILLIIFSYLFNKYNLYFKLCSIGSKFFYKSSIILSNNKWTFNLSY